MPPRIQGGRPNSSPDVAWLAAAAALLATAAQQALAIGVRVRPNGAPHDAPWEHLTPGNWEDLRAQLAATEHLGGLLAAGADWWLADAEGQRVDGWDGIHDLPPRERRFSLVPQGRLFQWGPGPAGERRAVRLPGNGAEGVELETVAVNPPVFLLHHLFTDAEATFLVERAGNRTGDNALAASGVGFNTKGPRTIGASRTSSSAFDADSKAAQDLMRRCFEALRIPWSLPMADGLQILRYQAGEAYVVHTDWFAADAASAGSAGGHDFDPTQGGSNRYATVFLYLRPPPSGGFTVFPRAVPAKGLVDSASVSTGADAAARSDAVLAAEGFFPRDSWEINMTSMCYSTLAVKPVELGAALFYHQHPLTGDLLQEAVHGACPSLSGVKWGANLWIWNKARHLTAAGGGTKSAPEPVQVRLQNEEGSPVDVEYSMDDRLTWVHFAKLGPGKATGSTSYGGHSWRFVAAGGGGSSEDALSVWTVPDATGVGHVTFTSSQIAGERLEM